MTTTGAPEEDGRGGRLIPVLTAVLCGLALYAWHPALLERIDQQVRDLAYQFRPSLAPPPDIQVVAVDEAAVKTLGRWPWPRRLQARLIRRIRQAGAAALVLDITYQQPEGEAADLALLEAIEAPGAPVVGGYFFRDAQVRPPPPAALKALAASRIRWVLKRPGARPEAIPSRPYVEAGQAEIIKVLAGLGFFNVVPDPDGLVRTTPLVLAYGSQFYPSLPLQGLAHYLDLPIGLEIGPEGATRVLLGEHDIPCDPQAEMPVDFYSGQRPIPMISATEVLAGQADPRLRGRLVFLGITELGIADLRATPVNPVLPGVVVQASVAANILQGRFLHAGYEATLVDVLSILLLPFLAVWSMSLPRHPLLMLAALAGSLGSILALDAWLWSRDGLLASPTYPFLPTFAAGIAYITWRLLAARRRTRFLRQAFASYVAPSVVEQVVNHPEELSLHGEAREVSVLFSDIRGFTSLSENLPPRQLVRLLNRYLGRMTDVIMDHQGTLEKYIGDAIMALYNAPLLLPDHPFLAVQTGLEMLAVLKELNAEFEGEFGLRLRIGVGVHTGPAIIGNLGSERRFQYTAVGDTINLGSRLEGLTKAYGVPLILSAHTRAALGERIPCRRLDRVQVVGKHRAVEIHEALPPGSPLTEDWLGAFETALGYYFDADFARATETFAHLLETAPGDGPSRIFLKRCRHFMEHPPPSDWDGIWVARNK